MSREKSSTSTTIRAMVDDRDPSSCSLSVSLVEFTSAKFSYSTEAKNAAPGASLNLGLIGDEELLSGLLEKQDWGGCVSFAPGSCRH